MTQTVQDPKPNRLTFITNTARLGIWLVAAVLVLVIGLMRVGASAGKFSELLTAAQLSNTTNNLTADSAPKQTVVTGWYSNDLLSILAQQNNMVLNLLAGLLQVVVVIGLAIALHHAVPLLAALPQALSKKGAPEPEPSQWTHAAPAPDAPQPPAPDQAPPAGYAQ